MLRVICVRFSSGLPKRIRPTKEQRITEYGDYRDFTNTSTNSDFDKLREPGFLTRPRFVRSFILIFLTNKFEGLFQNLHRIQFYRRAIFKCSLNEYQIDGK